MLPEAIIFDLDDTLISLKGTANDTWKLIVGEYSERNENINPQLLYDTITETRLSYWADSKNNDSGRKNQNEARREIVRLAFDKLKLPIEDAVPVADTFSSRRLDALKLFPGVLDTLDVLKRTGVKLALITNGEAKIQRFKIEKFKLQEYFQSILIETEAGFGKPDPRIFNIAMKAMQVDCRQTWSVGDNLVWDV